MFSVKGYFDGHNYITDGKAETAMQMLDLSLARL